MNITIYKYNTYNTPITILLTITILFIINYYLLPITILFIIKY